MRSEAQKNADKKYREKNKNKVIAFKISRAIDEKLSKIAELQKATKKEIIEKLIENEYNNQEKHIQVS